MTAPFTYLIGWSNLDRWYIGARWAKGCSPSDLWTQYFTSSKRVKEFVKANGEPDVIEIDRTFEKKKQAIERELFLLQMNRAVERDCFLNKAVGGVFDPSDPDIARAISKALTGKKQPPEVIEKRAARKRGKPHSVEHTKRISEAHAGVMLSQAHRDAIRAAKFGNRNRAGTTTSEQGRANIGRAKLGTSHNEETRARMAEAHRARNARLVQCVHCPKIGGEAAMKTWHFDKCKFRQETPK